MTISSTERGNRAFGLGSRAGRLLWAAVALALATAAVVYFAGGHKAQAAKSASAQKYGGLPAWLPKSPIPDTSIVQASAAHPKLAVEGDTVSVHLAGGQVLATAVGPQVPEEGGFPVPATTACSFTITFARASGVVPLRTAAFATVDEYGHLHRLHAAGTNGGRFPAQVNPGQTVTIVLRAVLPTGSGTLMWAPGSGKPIVSWAFAVEID